MRKCFFAIVFLVFCPLLFAQQTLDNNAIVKLIKAGLSDDLIVNTINLSPGNYDTTANGLIALKKANASDKVIGAILRKASGAAPGASSPSAPEAQANGLPVGIEEVGVYIKDASGAWAPMLPEMVIFESSGKFKNIASAGIVKGNLNGRIDGSRSKMNATLPVSFAIYLPEGVAITEYQLLHLRPNAGSRQFLSAAGGVLHTSAGAARDEVEFQPQKLAPRLYQITLTPSAGRGEYGLLAPGSTTGSNKETKGKIYTVSVAE
ncbi:MAG: hypothetical protein ACLPXT_13515 [Terracidiphilus sp.]